MEEQEVFADNHIRQKEGQTFLKIVVLGNVRLNKMSTLQDYVQPTPSSRFKLPKNCDFSIKDFKTPSNTPVFVELWDATDDPEGIADLNEKAAKLSHSADVTILLFEMEDPLSFKALQHWFELFLETATPRNMETFPFIVVGVEGTSVKKQMSLRSYAKADEKKKKVRTEADNVEVDPAVKAKWELKQFRLMVQEWCAKNHDLPFYELPAADLKHIDVVINKLASSVFSKENSVMMVRRKPGGFWHVPDRSRDVAGEMRAVALPGTNLVTRVNRDPLKVHELKYKMEYGRGSMDEFGSGATGGNMSIFAKDKFQRSVEVPLHQMPYVQM